MSRVLEKYKDKISQKYKKGYHNGIDDIGDTGSSKNTGALDYITAHSCGVVVSVRSNYKTTDKTGNSYGNYVMLKHFNGYYTLYAHLKYGTVTVKKGTQVIQGERLGFMGATGHCNGAHLHFEVRNADNIRIDPTPYLNADLPMNNDINSDDLKNLLDYNTIAKEVIQGKWGNGEERKKKLTDAGYNFSEVQKLVNAMVNGETNEEKKNLLSLSDIAKEVIRGKWGNGEERKKKLTDAGYNFSEVQKEVNRRLR